jgi:predicted enzyme related to lactoylglutathione lyase/glyoxylase-like metal-dependent hydrolase (beta-lactamase superfamily II)
MDFGRSGPSVSRLKSGAKVVTFNLNKARLHTYVAPEKSFGNASHIIEGPNFITIVDSQYMVPYSKELRKYADSLEKPIIGVIVSHAHPDHYFGLASAFSDVPSYALKEVIRDIKTSGPQMIQEAKENLGDLVPDKITIPTNVLELGEVNVDGIRYRYSKIEKAESDVQVVIELPEINTVIVQDAVYNGYHPWLGGNIDNWTETLDKLKKTYKDDYIVLVGHGMPGDPDVYDEMKKYLQTSKNILKSSKGSSEKVQKELTQAYPKYKGSSIIPMYMKYINHSDHTDTEIDKNVVNWFEIPVKDMDRAVHFYETVFRYKLKKVPPLPSEPDVEMAWFPQSEEREGASGSLVKGKNYIPCTRGTLIYFRSDDIDKQLDIVKELGGEVIQDKTLISPEIGFMGIFKDTEGNKIALHSRH